MSEKAYKGGPSITDIQSLVEADKIYKLSSNENPFPPSPNVVAAIQAAASTLNIYPPRDDDTLRAALATYHGRGLTDDCFYSADSGYETLSVISQAFLEPDDEVIVCSPTFGVYMKTAGLEYAKVVDVPLDTNDFSHNIDGILAAITERTRLIYICNPGNPTAAVMPAAEMTKLVENVPDHVVIIADEVYSKFVEDPTFPDSVQHVLDGKNVIIVQTFSKAHALAGLRLGYGIAPPHLTKRIWNVRRSFHINSLALAGGIAALEDEAYVQKCTAVILENKRWVVAELDKLGVEQWPSATNFVLFRPNRPANQVNDHLIKRGIMLRTQSHPAIADCLRVSIGSHEANQAFIKALAEAVAAE